VIPTKILSDSPGVTPVKKFPAIQILIGSGTVEMAKSVAENLLLSCHWYCQLRSCVELNHQSPYNLRKATAYRPACDMKSPLVLSAPADRPLGL
jgi:hypothetical protein